MDILLSGQIKESDNPEIVPAELRDKFSAIVSLRSQLSRACSEYDRARAKFLILRSIQARKEYQAKCACEMAERTAKQREVIMRQNRKSVAVSVFGLTPYELERAIADFKKKEGIE